MNTEVRNIRQFILRNFKDAKTTKGSPEVRINCIHPDHPNDVDHKLWINTRTGKFQCFFCGWRSKHFEVFLKAVKHRDFKTSSLDSIDFTSKSRYKNLSEKIEKTVFPSVIERILAKDVRLPEGTDFIKSQSLAYNYLINRRHMTKADIQFFRLMRCNGVSHSFNERIIIPFFDLQEKLIYYIGRSYTGKVPKVLNPSKELVSRGKESVLFNYHNVVDKDFVVMTEGVFDAMTVPNGVALLGKTASPIQLDMLSEMKAKKIYVFLDFDAKGESLDLIENLLRRRKEVYYVPLSDSRDANDLGKETCQTLLQTAIRMNLQELISLKLKGGSMS